MAERGTLAACGGIRGSATRSADPTTNGASRARPGIAGTEYVEASINTEGLALGGIGPEGSARGASTGDHRTIFHWRNRYRLLRFGSDVLLLVVALLCAELSSI